eukprot:1140667-Pelagomonas_calceolata.AAC.6
MPLPSICISTHLYSSSSIIELLYAFGLNTLMGSRRGKVAEAPDFHWGPLVAADSSARKSDFATWSVTPCK